MYTSGSTIGTALIQERQQAIQQAPAQALTGSFGVAVGSSMLTIVALPFAPATARVTAMAFLVFVLRGLFSFEFYRVTVFFLDLSADLG